MDLDFLKSKWNLLFGAAETILVPISGFVDVPSYASVALSTNANYGLLARFVLAIVIALTLIPCNIFNKKTNRYLWAVLTILLLSTSLWIYFKNTTIKKSKTIDYTTYNGTYVVKGNHLFPQKDSLLKEMEKAKGSSVSETEFFAENHEVNDSTGVLTAADLWPKEQIDSNAKEIILYYLATVLLFSLTAICAVQTVFCISAKE